MREKNMYYEIVKNYIMKSKLIIALLSVIITIGVGFNNIVEAQSSSGSLSFNPSSANLTDSATTSFAVVYTGANIAAAELHFTIPANVELTDLRPGPNLIEIYKSVANSEIHVGNLTSVIQTGSTLAYVDVQGITCGAEGTIAFNRTDTMIPDITLTFTDATYTINCDGGEDPTPTEEGGGSGTGSITTLPETDFSDDTFWNLLYASAFLSAGIGIIYLFKNFLQTKEEESN
jgi:hypothetical protein